MSPSLLCLCLVFALAFADEGCDKLQCKGPIKYYEELACKPVYAKEGDCCAIKYDCSHLEGRSPNKCYANGHEYSVGDWLKDEDHGSLCYSCSCREFDRDKASFLCSAMYCYNPPPAKPGCFRRTKPDQCCPGEEVCPENRATCVVDGRTYLEGQSFYPQQKPDLSCLCMEGFKGEFVEPFCKKVVCDIELFHSAEVKMICAPIYRNNQSPVTDCNIAFRCQNDKDKVIKASGEASGEDKSGKSASDEKSSDMKCAFGNMLMNVGDHLNQVTNNASGCVKCVCEVPPTPTCRKFSDSECDKSNHPDFH